MERGIAEGKHWSTVNSTRKRSLWNQKGSYKEIALLILRNRTSKTSLDMQSFKICNINKEVQEKNQKVYKYLYKYVLAIRFKNDNYIKLLKC